MKAPRPCKACEERRKKLALLAKKLTIKLKPMKGKP